METMRAARDRYFEENKFGPDGGYSAKWVDFKLGPFPFRFPNTPARVRAVRYHDLHHVVTGYRTNLVGEFEIAAFEIASGCRDFVAAWILNLAAMGGGIWRCPRRSFRAFVRGRRAFTLYGSDVDAVLGRPIDDVREEMALPAEPPRPTAADVALFALTSWVGTMVGLFFLVVGVALGPVGALKSWWSRRREASAPARLPGSPARP